MPRQPHADATATLGTIHSKQELRDAVHLAVYQVTASEKIKPGQPISVNEENKAFIDKSGKALGIADPFLTSPVKYGDKFWLILNPGMITSLRHVWEHDAFKTAKEEINNMPKGTDGDCNHSTSHDFINNLAETLEIDFDDLMEHASNYIAHGNYYNGGYQAEGEYASDEFWDHYEKLTGKTVSDNDRGNFISCSC